MKATKPWPRRSVGRPPKGSRARRAPETGGTATHILNAAAKLLAEQGFTGFGVNALAAAAGVDKQLIYYHFGGLDGVVRHLGSKLDLWLGTPLEPRVGEAYGDAVNRLLTEYFDTLQRSPLVLQLLAWELAEPSPTLAELETARSAAMAGWVEGLRAAAQPVPNGIDAPAINALLLAGLHYLALRRRSVGRFAGVDISTAAGQARIAAALRLITERTFATAVRAPPDRARRGAKKAAS